MMTRWGSSAVGCSGGVILPVAEVNLIAGAPKLLGDPVADCGAGRMMTSARGGRPGGFGCARLGHLGLRRADCAGQPVYQRG